MVFVSPTAESLNRGVWLDDILGVCLEMKHFKTERDKNLREEDHVRIETVHVSDGCGLKLVLSSALCMSFIFISRYILRLCR
jgi:hypothetical protein